MMWDVAIVVIAVLFFSLFEDFLVLPAHLGNEKTLSRKYLQSKNRGIRKYFEGFIIWLRDRVYNHLLNWLVKWRYIAASFPVALVLITMGLFMGGHIRNTFFPMVDFDQFTLNVAFTPGDGEWQLRREGPLDRGGGRTGGYHLRGKCEQYFQGRGARGTHAPSAAHSL